MQNNLIELYAYDNSRTAAMHKKYRRKSRQTEQRFLAAADAVIKLTVSGCMIFCCYLAYTML